MELQIRVVTRELAASPMNKITRILAETISSEKNILEELDQIVNLD